MTPDPKTPRIKLNEKEYRDLRMVIYDSQLNACHKCGGYMDFDMMDLHHVKSRGAGGDDSFENCVGVHRDCHISIHS
jgi:5-methylcytosine-specific restriction endonuclease McrA